MRRQETGVPGDNDYVFIREIQRLNLCGSIALTCLNQDLLTHFDFFTSSLRREKMFHFI